MRTKLKQFRIGLHLKQAEMAEKIGVSRATYAYTENGVRNPQQVFWDNLQKVYGLSDEMTRQLQKMD